jgi:uncharacterized protein DUF6647
MSIRRYTAQCRAPPSRPLRRRLSAWLAALMLALAQVPAGAYDIADSTFPTPDVVRQLILWIGERTDYDTAPVLADPPSVDFSKTGAYIEYEGGHIFVMPGLRGVYDNDRRRIFLVEPWLENNPRQVSTLLHELIHVIQFASRDWECAGIPEWEAYKLQHAWLAEHDIESGFNWFRIFHLSRCPRDIHP